MTEPVQPHKQQSYYGLPVLKRPHWKWEIALYFWMGGVGSGAYTAAALADLLGGEEDRDTVQTGRFLALLMLVASPVLLIMDLHKPAKFYNMLRIVKLKSPMSAGSWILSIFGAFTGLSALLELFFGGKEWHWLRKLVGLAGLPWALLLGGYTGILISATAIPIWFKNRLLWGPTFLASAFSTGLAAVQAALLVRGKGSHATLERLETAHTVAAVAETALLAAGLAQMGDAAKPITRGVWSTLFWPGAVGVGLLLPLAMHLLGMKSRGNQFVSACCTLLGGLIFRWCIVYAGKNSADDAEVYFRLMREMKEKRGR